MRPVSTSLPTAGPDPFEVSDADTMLTYLKSVAEPATSSEAAAPAAVTDADSAAAGTAAKEGEGELVVGRWNPTYLQPPPRRRRLGGVVWVIGELRGASTGQVSSLRKTQPHQKGLRDPPTRPFDLPSSLPPSRCLAPSPLPSSCGRFPTPLSPSFPQNQRLRWRRPLPLPTLPLQTLHLPTLPFQTPPPKPPRLQTPPPPTPPPPMLLPMLRNEAERAL